MAKNWNISNLRARAGHAFNPQTGIEQSQGDLYKRFPGVGAQVRQALDPGVNLQGWVNPYSMVLYNVGLNVNQPVQAAPPNLKRAYLIVQNQGPGNVFLNFGQAAVAPTVGQNANCLQLIQTQFYEQVGGGSVDMITGLPIAGLFVSPDYLSAITDMATTTLMVAEGVFMISRWIGLGTNQGG